MSGLITTYLIISLQVDSGALEPPIIPDLRHPGDSDQYPEYGEDMWWDVHELAPADRDRFTGF